ncbi:hypothetical protein ACGF3J_37425 [Streptomyces sp. NPDC048171]|uniref:hypothetical protein n=1 Tax=Streptomyces sp. NPDC048171 TaxID=3365504 RepID=UPI00371CDD94
MSEALEKAEAAAREAAQNTVSVEKIVAAVLAAQAAQQQPTPPAPAPRPEFDAKKWIVIGGVVVSVGLVGALFALAIAIAACAGTGSFLILRSVYLQTQKNR